ncbi:class I SAM-dependent methyltransferase [Streptomyces sp. MP131-18]|uniref:class I SAM-dependent methyltransferase n=1 Tax=Streptomyces sp. MP131-18 TaxID=1857892 RepID=UPI00097C5912|nr:class I SAM-dependent methyltransferase [Streptomyces sp. MP131-18]ONK13802.1 Demethylrebeccamycin-D-glucose O-methyltransferase [Streptomyces sp. MP131-18]
MRDHSAAIAGYWDAAAASFDEEPDHGLRADATRAAWAALLRSWLPAPPAEVLDAGCGTGSLSLLLAEDGHRVVGVDLSQKMIQRARAKFAAAQVEGRFLVGDAAVPPADGTSFDAVLCRHLIWTLPDPVAALREWVARLRPGGRLVLVEGRWGRSGEGSAPYADGAGGLPWQAGVGAADLAACVRPLVAGLRIEPLSDVQDLWGGAAVSDERYALIGEAGEIRG